MAIIFHQGSESIGHYFSVVRSIGDAVNAYNGSNHRAGQWFECNDTTKRKIKIDKINRWITKGGDPTPYQCIYYKAQSLTPPTTIVIPSLLFNISMEVDS